MNANIETTEKVLFGISGALMLVTSLVMNFLVCYVIYRNRQLRHQFSSVFIINLAVCDLLIALLAMPFSFGAVVLSEWPFGSALCHLTGFANQSLGISAILTLAVISIDRFYAVIKPLKYRAKMTMYKAVSSIAYVWIQAMLFSVIPTANTWFIFNEHYFFCTFSSDFRDETQLVFTTCLYLANFALPLVIMLFAYYKIFRIARRHSRRIGPAVFTLGSFGIMANTLQCGKEMGRQREAKAARKILFVIAAFFCCNAPYSLLRLLEITEGSSLDLPSSVTICAKWVNFLKSSLNPIIYGLLQRRFRNALSGILWNKPTERYPFFRRISVKIRTSQAQPINNDVLQGIQENSDRKFWLY